MLLEDGEPLQKDNCGGVLDGEGQFTELVW